LSEQQTPQASTLMIERLQCTLKLGLPDYSCFYHYSVRRIISDVLGAASRIVYPSMTELILLMSTILIGFGPASFIANFRVCFAISKMYPLKPDLQTVRLIKL